MLKQKTVQDGTAAYHGYWGLDFTTVDPHLGSDADYAAFVECAHRLGMKVILDVVVNHTADVVSLAGSEYNPAAYRDCRGRRFDPAAYVTAKRFPCLSRRNMPWFPTVPSAEAGAKKPAWLNDPLRYHDRGDIDFSNCSQRCYEQGDFFGLDDLFTEQPVVMKGLAAIYGDWIRRFKVDGFRVDTARHVNAAFFRLWVPRILASAKKAGVGGFSIFGEVPLTDDVELSAYVRDRGLPNVLDFPFQQDAVGYAAGVSSPRAVATRLADDDYFLGPSGVAATPATFLGNHDMGRAALQVANASHASGQELVGQAAARLRPDVSPPRRAGRPLRRRGRDDRPRRRPAGAAGHVPDAGRRVEDAGAGRLAADRERVVVRYPGQPDPGPAAGAGGAARREPGALDRLLDRPARERQRARRQPDRPGGTA